MTKRRTFYIDHIRTVLTVLVILHHTAITYGALGGWYWRERGTDLVNNSQRILCLFCTVNQSYFMGFFFLLAGYFTPAAYDRKGPRTYFIDRVVRLGIPLLVYGFCIAPVTVALAQFGDGKPFLETLISLLRRAYFDQGPLWFVQALLLFSVGYLAWRTVRPLPADPPFPHHMVIFLSAIAVGIVAFLLRLDFPVGKVVCGFQIGYFASYIFLFVIGCLAFRGSWLEQITIKQICPWFGVSLIALSMLPMAVLFLGNQGFNGGMHWNAAIYAIWEPLVAWGLILMYLWSFRTYLDRPLPGSAWLAQRNYAVYIIHPPILVGISVLFHSWTAPILLKFAVTGGMAAISCYMLASVLLCMPRIRRIL